MKGYKYLVVITQREWTEDYLDFFKSYGIARVITTLCSGTSTDVMLNLIGLEKTEKAMHEVFIRSDKIKDVCDGLYSQMSIGLAGNGIAFLLPIECVGGESALKYLTGETKVYNSEEEQMETNNSLIITIIEKGNTEQVMEVARSAGATGGTVIKAKGTGAEIAKFFGISISDEKEMIYIISSKENRDGIMRAIMDKSSEDKNLHAVVFSLPVEKVLGIKSLENN